MLVSPLNWLAILCAAALLLMPSSCGRRLPPQYDYRHFNKQGQFIKDHGFKKTNLLFIIYDDLRPELSNYGKPHMITPNFDRLAKKSVTFTRAYSQVAVCNPSRISLMTGLRPDYTGIFGFESGYKPLLIWPTQLARSGYKTSGFGKIRHHEGPDKEVWNYRRYDGNPDWYTYQNNEWSWMNSSVMPDNKRNEEDFPDFVFSEQAITTMKEHHKQNSHYFMIGLGFKMPHLCLHVPYRHFNMYKPVGDLWLNTSEAYLSFPPSTPMMGYRCCAEESFRYMEAEGAALSTRFEHEIHDMNKPTTKVMHNELMRAYSSMITFTDERLGRVLDTIDELKMWDNITIVLTSDHGMHNGEKSIWEKWTLFEESVWVPLMIYHPDSPYKGQSFEKPVELIDIFPTIIDLLVSDYDKKNVYVNRFARHTRKFVPLHGKSLAPLVLGPNYDPDERPASSFSKTCLDNINNCENNLNGFALSQSWRCSDFDKVDIDPRRVKTTLRYSDIWKDCSIKNKTATAFVVSVMGYSMRTADFRYTAWLNWDQLRMTPIWDDVLYDEELYDHRSDTLSNRYNNELVNHAKEVAYTVILINLRHQLLNYLYQNVTYNMKVETEAAESARIVRREVNVNQTAGVRLGNVRYGGMRYRGPPHALGISSM